MTSFAVIIPWKMDRRHIPPLVSVPQARCAPKYGGDLSSCDPALFFFFSTYTVYDPPTRLMSSIDTFFAISPHDLYPAFPVIPKRPVPRKTRSHVHSHLRYSPYARPQLDLTYIVRCSILVLVPL